MKNWNAPVAEELEIKLTANGFFACNKEVCIWTHNSSNTGKPDDGNTSSGDIGINDKEKDQQS